ncbi:Rpp20 subunit of nuclear RNase MRP and P-domain-containing protein [Xylogone sp. PMI_703]|nr:Rpp20 subunit of nuclear RNase MRP and P-domain-containing protein [Xylogone sp. PMI_703]
MAKEYPATTLKTTPPKNPRLPDDKRIRKRPLLHPPIAGLRAGSSTPKIVYVSASSPFISVVKRVRKYLSEIDKRASQNVDLLRGPNKTTMGKMQAALEKRTVEEVIIKGTGKAIEKVLRLAMFFQGQADVTVKLRTGSVGAIDDVVNKDGDEDMVEESRIRRTSCLEVAINLK